MCTLYKFNPFRPKISCHFCSTEQKAKEEVDGIDVENLAVLERLKQNQRQSYLKVSIYLQGKH